MKQKKKPTKRAVKKRKLDPELKERNLTATPRVVKFKDYKGKGLIRVLWRANKTLFPELALFLKFRGMAHELQDDMLKDAGLTEEKNGKWVLRTNKFNIFVYV